jgi:hypothetical protein
MKLTEVSCDQTPAIHYFDWFDYFANRTLIENSWVWDGKELWWGAA